MNRGSSQKNRCEDNWVEVERYSMYIKRSQPIPEKSPTMPARRMQNLGQY